MAIRPDRQGWCTLYQRILKNSIESRSPGDSTRRSARTRGWRCRRWRMREWAAETVSSVVGFDVAEQFERDQEPAHGGAGQRRVAGDFGDGQTVGMAFAGFEHTKAAREREDEVWITLV